MFIVAFKRITFIEFSHAFPFSRKQGHIDRLVHNVTCVVQQVNRLRQIYFRAFISSNDQNHAWLCNANRQVERVRRYLLSVLSPRYFGVSGTGLRLYTFIMGKLLYDRVVVLQHFLLRWLLPRKRQADPFVSRSRHCSYLKSKTYFSCWGRSDKNASAFYPEIILIDRPIWMLIMILTFWDTRYEILMEILSTQSDIY